MQTNTNRIKNKYICKYRKAAAKHMLAVITNTNTKQGKNTNTNTDRNTKMGLCTLLSGWPTTHHWDCGMFVLSTKQCYTHQKSVDTGQLHYARNNIQNGSWTGFF